MTFPLLPWVMTESLCDVTPAFLTENGIRLLMLDFDNTVVPYTTDEPTEEMAQWIREMCAAGVTLCVVSNSRNGRVLRFCDDYGIPCITKAGKPGVHGIRSCMERFSAAPAECALVGDQIYTDTLGANLAGVRPILVRSIHNHTVWLKLRHAAEIPFIFMAKNRRMKK